MFAQIVIPLSIALNYYSSSLVQTRYRATPINWLVTSSQILSTNLATDYFSDVIGLKKIRGTTVTLKTEDERVDVYKRQYLKTREGWRQARQIYIGDYVYTREGFKRIESVSFKAKREFISINLNGSIAYYVNNFAIACDPSAF